MIRLELADVDPAWPGDADWPALVEAALSAAVAQTPYAALTDSPGAAEVSVTLADDGAVHTLNRDWRDKDKPTNVLSFPQEEPEDIAGWLAAGVADGPELLLGDIILAAQTCAREAADKGVPVTAHASHLVVHAMLHLLGYDHIDPAEADAMEALEVRAMAALGLSDPYAD